MELSYTNNPKSLFRKYAKLVTWFANTQLGRDYLQDHNFTIPNEKIGLFLPNGYHVIKEVGDKKIILQATFTTRAVYASKLYPALYAIDHLHQWIEDFDEAKMILLGQLGLVSWGRMPALAKSLRFLTLEKNPDPDPETTSVDGDAFRGAVDEAWATIRSGAGQTARPSDTSIQMGNIEKATTNWRYITRLFTLFDTSSLTADATISAATYSLYATSKNDFFTQSVGMVTTTPASNTNIVAADYSQSGTTRQATDLTIASITTSAYNDWTLDATGLSNISKTSITKFGTRISGDLDNSEPAGGAGGNNSFVNIDSAEATNKPKIVITYTLPGTGGYMTMNKFWGP